MKGKGIVDTHLGMFDPDVLGIRLWRNFKRFEKMTKVPCCAALYVYIHGLFKNSGVICYVWYYGKT